MDVAFICSGSRRSGLGHVSRCIALAEALGELGARSTFAGPIESVAAQLLREEAWQLFGTGSVADMIPAVCKSGVTVLVIDADATDVEEVGSYSPSRTGAGLVIIDDYARLAPYPDDCVVLNFTVAANELDYPGKGVTRLLGPRYALFRRSLCRARRTTRALRSNGPRHIAVGIGGIDPSGLNTRIESMLAEAFPSAQIHVLAGLPGGTVARHLANADAAVTGGGLLKYEAAFVGTPPGVISQTADEARETLQFVAAGLAADIGQVGETDEPTLLSRLVEFLSDGSARKRLRANAMLTFPDDPAANTATAVYSRYA